MNATHVPPLAALPFDTFVANLFDTEFADKELDLTSYRPTIIVGLGGTGSNIVRGLKQHIRRHFDGERAGAFQFTVIDTTAEEIAEGETPLDPGEFLHLESYDAAEQIRNLADNPYLLRWWPGGIERPYRPAFSGTGANRVRAVARQALFHYVDTITQRLGQRVDDAIEVNGQYGFGAKSVKIYVIGSSAGGTCSGMFIDICYLARMLALRQQPTAYITGVLVMDDAFRPLAKTSNTAAEFSANTLALLKEINYFNNERTFHETYTDILNTEELPEGSYRPCDVLYLLGLHNTQGQALDSFDSLADMISAEIMLEIASPLRNRATNVLDNVRANERYIAGQPAAYSSFALSSLIYPIEGIASWCALNTHQAFSKDVLLTPHTSASQVEDEVITFMQRAEIEEELGDQLIDRLASDAAGDPLYAPIISHDQVAGVAEPQLMGTLQRLEASALDQLAMMREATTRNVEAVQRAFVTALKTEMETLVRDPERGPRYAGWFINAVTKRLTRMRDDEMLGEQSLYQAEADGQQTAWQTAKSGLAEALRLPRINPLRRRRVAVHRDSYSTALNAYLASALELEKRVQAAACFDTFLKEGRRLLRRSNDLLNGWDALAALVGEQASKQPAQRRATQTDYSLMRNIVGGAELDRIYRRHAPPMDEASQRVHLASRFWDDFADHVSDWSISAETSLDYTRQHPAVHVYYFLFSQYAQAMQNNDLFERMKEIFQTDWQREIELSFQRTAPFWNYNLGRFGSQIQSNLQDEPQLVGYGGSADNWAAKVKQATGENPDCINTKNPHQLVFLKTSHGLPLFALRSLNNTLKNSYEYVQKLWQKGEGNPIPLHISTQWEGRLGSIMPQASPAPNGSNGQIKMIIPPDFPQPTVKI